VIAAAQTLVEGAVAVASPPLIYERLMRVINDPRSGSADVARVIGEDQGLTARLLRTVNSAFYSFPRPIDTVTQAVTVVGTRQVRDLALATSVMSMFDDVPAELIDLPSFWHHSLACGTIARVIASHRREDNVERYFVAGLLHDIGRLIIFQRAGTQSAEAIVRSRETGQPLFACEAEVLGCDHAQVGDALLEKWNFRGAFRDAVLHHHRPRSATKFPAETAAVHVADIVANALAWGRSGQMGVPPFEPEAWESLGIDPMLVPMLIEEAERQLGAALHLLGGDA
jgi:putative nucleotidyltransferase with HDIG domain